MDDYYDILEVPHQASYEEIKLSYQKLVLLNHPDKSSDPHAPETFRRIHAAWKILGGTESRIAYDETLSAEDHVGANAEEVSIDDFEHVGDKYSKSCRCGSSYDVRHPNEYTYISI